MEKLKWLLKVSRPRFWAYLLGPYVVGFAAQPKYVLEQHGLLLLTMALFFTLPANLLIYGINDVYDYETDKKNPKKQGYEALVTPKRHNFLAGAIASSVFPFVLPFLFWPSIAVPARISLALFLLFGVGYSAPPIRAKAKPFLDTLFNSLYVFPALVSYGIVSTHWPPIQFFIAAVLWCMAMHAYSAIPDIAADKKARIQTIATVLGKKSTLIFCMCCYILAVVLTLKKLQAFTIFAAVIYIGMMLISLFTKSRTEVFRLYKLFPYINFLVGFVLFWYCALFLRAR